MSNISIIGAGAWGTTLSILAAENKHNVKLWIYEKELADDIAKTRENKTYLPGVQLPVTIDISSQLKDALNGADLVIFAVPTQFLRKTAGEAAKYLDKGVLVLNVSKGIEIKTLKRPSEIIEEETKINDIAVLSGPNLSREIADGLPAASVVACRDANRAKKVQKLLNSERFRIYSNDDVIGVEISGALKNVAAIAAGIADGLKLGDNAKAGLLVRAMTEIQRLGQELGARGETFFGLSGIGDMIATCSSELSRNHKIGARIAMGQSLRDIVKGAHEVAEGIATAKAVHKLAKKLNVNMPITEQVYTVLFEDKNPLQAISDLMRRPIKPE
ncbi:MAG: NAD(P)H-dependent glycerol-3-phosphate dehydrogenase [Candidatus Margulisiibacteriota bacterium]